MTMASSVPATSRFSWLLAREVAEVGLTTHWPSQQPDAHRADRGVEGDVGDVEGGGGADDGQGVGVVLHVGGEQEADDLGLAAVALGEERPQRAVDQAARSGSPSRSAGPRA